ncbi:MAG: preprotein translocase subunit YajC [Bacteroidota bacterium]|nr:preprotein translocase subunit YajC [Bacteroidota bacterium]
MNLPFILLMAQQQGAKPSNPFVSFLPIVFIIAIFYFFMIRPQIKKTKEQKKYIQALGKGDKIITIGGIHGKIVEVQETTLIIEVEGGNRLKIEKSAVAMDANAQLTEKK